MISASSSLVVEGRHVHGLGPPPHHMTFAAHEPEFARPLPKSSARYNGSAAFNGCRVVPTQPGPRVSSKYHEPVNLAAPHKEDPPSEEPPPHPFPGYPLYPGYHYPSLPGPYGSLYPGHYTPLLPRAPYPPPLETYRQSPPAAPLQPTPVRPGQSLLLRHQPFKVPSGKEGSLKHRILTRPESERSAVSAPGGGAGNFVRGSLIQLASGELRRVEDMRTEDFVSSAERSAELRLDPSTVVRIQENPGLGTAKLTLSYGEQRTQVELESRLDHPFFVYGQGWASCRPERSLQSYGLQCHRLQVGDICISLSPRPSAAAVSPSAAAGSRKRRWSAPDHFLEGAETPPCSTTSVSAPPPHRRPRE